MFRAQRVCLYFVAFLVLAAARPKISPQISQNQIGLRVIDPSTEERVPSKSSLATDSSSEELPTVTSSSEETSEAAESSSQETAESSEDSSEDESSESSDESAEGSYYYDYYSY
ncbi:uncharacterized protein Dyak_GE27663, isoform B [Drosophila yakuba]|uniref:Uncharacterized protein, isoform B n=2 Tax=Drosophila yakuba TaxID=7245 RepID=A0A0R1DQC2_DROYA|nr:uncharacterized protein Dyak_GE27663, isoform B [Drosophila yakuba]